jgi:nucleoid-associated protein YgaU
MIALALTLILPGACIPPPAGQASPTPIAGANSAAPASPIRTPEPTGPSPSPSFVRPVPTAPPTFQSYVVKAGDTLSSIAREHGTTARSLAFWNRTRYPSLDPDAPSYDPNRIEIGWVLLLVPDIEIDEDDTFPEPSAVPSPVPSNS